MRPIGRLCEMRASILTGWFENKDGLLTLWNDKVEPSEMELFRLLMTDSGHFLLPLDEQPHQDLPREEVRNYLTKVSEVSQSRWSDHSYVFWQKRLDAADPEQKRSSADTHHTQQESEQPLVAAENCEDDPHARLPSHISNAPTGAEKIYHAEEEQEDYWEIRFHEGQAMVTRVHVRERRVLFRPEDAPDMPPGTDPNSLDEVRVTELIPTDGGLRQPAKS